MYQGQVRTSEELRENYNRCYTNLKAAIADSIEHLEKLLESYEKVQQMFEQAEQGDKD